eukprot:6477919-Amphidinium_carterae.1
MYSRCRNCTYLKTDLGRSNQELHILENRLGEKQSWQQQRGLRTHACGAVKGQGDGTIGGVEAARHISLHSFQVGYSSRCTCNATPAAGRHSMVASNTWMCCVHTRYLRVPETFTDAPTCPHMPVSVQMSAACHCCMCLVEQSAPAVASCSWPGQYIVNSAGSTALAS